MLNTSPRYNLSILPSLIRRGIQPCFQKSPFATLFLGLLICFSVFRPIFQNKYPIICSYKNQVYFPLCSSALSKELTTLPEGEPNGLFKLNFDWAIWPLCPWSAQESDIPNSGYVSPFSPQFTINTASEKTDLPFRFRHWLGCRKNGADVLAGIISGAPYALITGISCVSIALIIALLLGGLAAIGGNRQLKISRKHLLLLPLSGCLSWYYSFYIQFGPQRGLPFLPPLILCLLILIGFHGGIQKIKHFPFLEKKIPLAVDTYIMRIIDILDALPVYLILISIAAFFKPEWADWLFFLSLILSINLTRIVRNETMKIMGQPYIQAAKALGIPAHLLLSKHILKNVFPLLQTPLLYLFAGAILSEAGLRFMGLIQEDGRTTWGTLMGESLENFQAWWLSVFPGIMIILTLLCIYKLGRPIAKKQTDHGK